MMSRRLPAPALISAEAEAAATRRFVDINARALLDLRG